MGPSCKAPESNVSTTVAYIFWHKRALVQSVWAEYVKENRVTVNTLPCNSQLNIYQQMVPIAKMIICQIREFIRKWRNISEQVVAKYITVLLRSLGYLEYFPDDSLSMSNDVCSM